MLRRDFLGLASILGSAASLGFEWLWPEQKIKPRATRIVYCNHIGPQANLHFTLPIDKNDPTVKRAKLVSLIGESPDRMRKFEWWFAKESRPDWFYPPSDCIVKGALWEVELYV